MEYVTNAWYVAGWSSEITSALQRVTILEQHIVIYRTDTNLISALDDRCPHRQLPLSHGKRLGNNIQCGYHGLTFAPDGRCVRVPGQTAIPTDAWVRRYPVCEKHHIAWIWMGDANLADENKIFDLPVFNDKTWDAHQGDALHIQSNYLNVAENLVDPAHVSFVHPTTLGNPQSEDVPVNFDTKGETIRAWRWIRNAPPIGFFSEFGGFTSNVDRWHYYDLHLPSIAVIDFGSVDSNLELAEDDRAQGVRIYALHFLTPVNATHTIDHWMHIRNTACNDSVVSDKLDGLFRVAFNEDKEILELIQRQELLPQTRPPVRFAIDKGANMYRARIARLIKKEHKTKVTSGTSNLKSV